MPFITKRELVIRPDVGVLCNEPRRRAVCHKALFIVYPLTVSLKKCRHFSHEDRSVNSSHQVFGGFVRRRFRWLISGADLASLNGVPAFFRLSRPTRDAGIQNSRAANGHGMSRSVNDHGLLKGGQDKQDPQTLLSLQQKYFFWSIFLIPFTN